MDTTELAGAVTASLAQTPYPGSREVVSLRPARRGSINTTYTATMADGERLFVKCHAAEPGLDERQCLEMFEMERMGLEMLREAGCFRVPAPLATGRLAGGAFLAMEFIDLRPLRDMRLLGERLAAMHLAQGAERFGLESDNWIGATPQPNSWRASWVDFLRMRLEHQLDLAQLAGEDGRMARELLERLPSFFEGVEVRPSLVHGDLYEGNCAADARGEPVLFDPALYWGHHEAELGMVHFTGSFGPEFAEAYHQHIPRAPGFDRRSSVYQLYHALNHYNLFGRGYLSECSRLLRRALC